VAGQPSGFGVVDGAVRKTRLDDLHS